MGSPVEFWTVEQIRQEFGPDGIQWIAPSWGKPAAITDDTQMTLFTAEGLIRGEVRFANRGISHRPSVVASAYKRWLRTQEEPASAQSPEDIGLITVPELHSQRSPGHTCLSALRLMRTYGDQARNNSKGCGGVMRAAPVGIFGVRTLSQAVFELAMDTAKSTHGHPGGYLPAGCLAVIVGELMKGAPLEAAIGLAESLLLQEDGHEECSALLTKAQELGHDSFTPEAIAAKLGGGWTGDEALAIAVACSLAARDFDHGIRLAVNHDGDSDSTGAITGNILGARWGVAAINADRWLRDLELREIVEQLARDLVLFHNWDLTSDEVWRRYPGC